MLLGLGLPHRDASFLTCLSLPGCDPTCDTIMMVWHKRSLVITGSKSVEARINSFLFVCFLWSYPSLKLSMCYQPNASGKRFTCCFCKSCLFGTLQVLVSLLPAGTVSTPEGLLVMNKIHVLYQEQFAFIIYFIDMWCTSSLYTSSSA